MNTALFIQWPEVHIATLNARQFVVDFEPSLFLGPEARAILEQLDREAPHGVSVELRRDGEAVAHRVMLTYRQRDEMLKAARHVDLKLKATGWPYRILRGAGS